MHWPALSIAAPGVRPTDEEMALFPLRFSGRLAGLVVVLALLGGCATAKKPLYYWGDYQGMVYGHLRASKSPEEQIQVLETLREHAKAQGMAVPPGMQAHLALLYGQTGRADRLVENLEAEKNQFPEGAAYVDFLLKKNNR